MPHRLRRALVLAAAIAGSACGRQPGLFNDTNARAHVSMLAGTIGSRPVGSPANARAREYIVDQLKQIGFSVRVQETDARRHELGRTARVANIIATLPGQKPEALALVSHYDSSPDAPGATDDALGVAVTLEAARVLASRGEPGDRQWTVLALITDGEESGLMGAAGLVTDREVTSRLRAYINLESIGSAGTSVLFETGPANAWLVWPWARRAPHPRGGSYAVEVYRRLPNDTDFSILKTRDIPGLNFAAISDSYAYHTARDTPERLTRETIRSTGENVVSIVTALQQTDINRRSSEAATFFDIGGTVGVSYGAFAHWLLAALALITGVLAWVRLTGDAVRSNGVLRWILTLAWGWVGAALVAVAMAAATLLLRTAREVYHPWYARPGRLFLLLIATGLVVGWSMARAGHLLPPRTHPARHPALVWSVTLPIWLAVTGIVLWFAPAAAYLWVLPLLTAGLLLSVTPPRHDLAVRASSIVVVGVSGTMWLREANDLSRFVVAVMGRLPVVTPFFVYAALFSAAGMMVVPPMIAALSSKERLKRPWAVTAVVLLLFAAALGSAYMAPAYTHDQPLRRHVRALQEPDMATAVWEVGSVEPGLDLAPNAPGEWMPTDGDTAAASIPWGRYSFPFVFRATGPSLGPPPAAVTAFAVKPLADGSQLSVSVLPREPGLTVTFILPARLTPARSSLPGTMRLGRWTATFVAVPGEGIAWEASFHAAPETLSEVKVAVSTWRLPGGTGWQSLPAWLPQDTAVWSSNATWVLAASGTGTIAPVPPLR